MDEDESELSYLQDYMYEDQPEEEEGYYTEMYDRIHGTGEGSIDEQYGEEEETSHPEVWAPKRSETLKQNSLDDLSDHKLITLVNEQETEFRHLHLENLVFCSYLQDNDPAELEGLDNLVQFGVERMWEKTSASPLMPISLQDHVRMSNTSTRRSIRYDSFSSITSIVEGKGPKINLSQKSDMALKAMEEIQSGLEVFLKRSNRVRRNLKAELEEFSIREKDIKESLDSFQFNVLVQAVDQLTQRIPAEKFLRWMEEWLKSAQLNIEKLRLRTATLKIQLKKVSATLVQRQELGENVHAVDFDQLEIENKHFAEKLDLKNIQLIEMKRMSGGASLVLNNNKKNLRKLQEEYNGLKAQVLERERKIEETELECEIIDAEMEKDRNRYNSFKRLTMSYKVPDVMEYVNLKGQLNDVRKEIKVWHRRKKIQDITINACLRQMKNITGSSKVDRAWLENMPVEETIGSIDLEYDHIEDSDGEEYNVSGDDEERKIKNLSNKTESENF